MNKKFVYQVGNNKKVIVKLHLLLHLKLNKFYKWNFQSAGSKTYTKTMQHGFTKTDWNTNLLNSLPHLLCPVLNLCCDLLQPHHLQPNDCKLRSKIPISPLFHHSFFPQPSTKTRCLASRNFFSCKKKKKKKKKKQKHVSFYLYIDSLHNVQGKNITGTAMPDHVSASMITIEPFNIHGSVHRSMTQYK